MKNFIAVLALTTLIAAPSFAATKKVKKTTTTTTTTTDAPVVAPTPVPNNGPEFSGTFGLGTISSKFVFGVGFKAQWPVNIQGNDFKFGGRTGFYFGPSSPTTFVIPILATAEYDFRVNNALKPYVGLEMGLSWAHASTGSTDVTIGGFTTTVSGASASSTDFALLVVPGMRFGDKEMYFVEIPFGTMVSSFTVLPSIGMRF